MRKEKRCKPRLDHSKVFELFEDSDDLYHHQREKIKDTNLV